MKSALDFFSKNILGVILVTLVVFIAKIISPYIAIGSVACSIIIGLLINSFITLKESFKPGIKFSEKYLLSIAIILMGANLNLSILELIEFKIIVYIIVIIAFTISISLIFGKLFNISKSLSLLIGIGNGICGS